jgi:hypothetical protein
MDKRPQRSAKNKIDLMPKNALCKRWDTPLLEHVQLRATLPCLVQDHGDALAHRREGNRRGPLFSPERFRARATLSPGTKAFDAAAHPSHDAPHRPPNPLRSCCAGDMLPGDVRRWPPGHMPPGASQAPHWTEKSQPSPPLAGRGPGIVSPPTSPHHLADAEGCWRRLGASRLQPPRDLSCHRARRSSARMLHEAMDSRSRRCARDAGLGVPGRSTQGARLLGHAAPWATVPPTGNAHPRLPAAAATKKDAPSRRHRPSR